LIRRSIRPMLAAAILGPADAQSDEGVIMGKV